MAYGWRMPGESPRRDWDALLTPPPQTFAQVITAAQERRRRKMRLRAWSVFAYIVVGATFVAWFLQIGYVLSVPPPWAWAAIPGWLLELPLLCFLEYLILRRLERLLLPPADRELSEEE
jgi:hypothetical protein